MRQLNMRIFLLIAVLSFSGDLWAQENAPSKISTQTQKIAYLQDLWNENYQSYTKNPELKYKTQSGNFKELGCEGRGRINQIVIHPENDAVLFAITPGGGIWKSIDSGSTWSGKFQHFPCISTNWMAFHPTVKNMCFVATGDWRFGIKGDGLYYSRDQGEIWQKRGSPENEPVNLLKFIIHPIETHMIAAISSNNVYISSDTGTTWTTVHSGSFCDIVSLPGNPDILIASPLSGNTFQRSTDFGKSWHEIKPDTLILSDIYWRLTVNPLTLGSVFAFNSAEKLYKSTDGGLHFENIGSADVNPGFWNTAFFSHPKDSQLLFAGGIGFGYFHESKGFTALLNINGNYNGVDYHNFTVSSAGSMYLTNDNGIHKSLDGGSTWRKLPHSFNNQEVYVVTPSFESRSCIIGTQDGGSKWIKDSCISAGPNDGGRGILFPSGDKLAYSTDQTRRAYRIDNYKVNFMNPLTGLPGNFPYSFSVHPDSTGTIITIAPTDLKISRDTARTWQTIKNGGGTAVNLEYHPKYPNRLFAAYNNQIAISDDFGTSWKLYSKPPDISLNIRKMALHPTDSQRIYIITRHQVTQKYGIQMCTGGQIWTELPLPENDLIYTDIAIHPSGDIYASSLNQVFYFKANASIWIPFSNGLSSARITQISMDIPHNRLLVSTFGRGVWESELASQTGNIHQSNPYNYGKLYPNPARTHVEIEGLNSETYYAIYDLSGRKLKQGSTLGNISLLNLQPGTYILQWAEAKGISTARLCVQ